MSQSISHSEGANRKSVIAPFDRLVDQAMRQPPYHEARRVFAIMDNASSHHGAQCVLRLQEKFPHLVAVDGPVHASWLNQIEIYFSIVQRSSGRSLDATLLHFSMNSVPPPDPTNACVDS